MKKHILIKRKHKIHRTKPSPLFVFLSLMLLMIGLIYPKVKSEPVAQPLPLLDVPSLPQTVVTNPLTIRPFSQTVLGAQAFDPTDIVSAVNLERQKIGSRPLRLHASLMKAAQKRLDVIMKYQNFSHYDPYEKIELATVFPAVGYNYIYASENIGMGGTSGPDFVNGFMNSPTHRQNLLNPSLMDTGVAVTSGPYQQWYVNVVVQLFAIPAGKNEYLGYTQTDVKKYKRLLSDVKARLDPLNWLIRNAMRDQSYTEENRKKLQRQAAILETLYAKMLQEAPFTSDDVVRIIEYNHLIEPNS